MRLDRRADPLYATFTKYDLNKKGYLSQVWDTQPAGLQELAYGTTYH